MRAIEQNQLYTERTRQIVQKYLTPLIDQQIDTLVYGCTHYKHLEETICTLLPSSVKIIDPAEHIVVAVEKELSLLGLSNDLFSRPTQFYVSGSPRQFASLSQQWLGYYPHVKQIATRQVSTEMLSLNQSYRV